VVLDSPGSFESELAALKGVEIIRDLKKAKEVTFALAFVTTQEQINALAPAIARKAGGDAIVWFAYPKGTSKKYKSQINRDSGWNMLATKVLSPSAWWRLTRIGPQSASGAPASSRTRSLLS
jgi:hypothetical protein